MSKLLFTMTDAGRQELVNANKTGTNKVEIVSVGLGSRYYVTSTSQTNITNEIKRLTTIGGKVVSPDTIHVTAKDDSKDEYVVHTIGLYTNKGTLFAVYSQEQAIINKASSTIALISSDIAIKTLDTKNITFGDIEFINPPATETVVGVARFANEQEIDAGTDDSLAVSAKRLKQAIVKHEQSRNHPDATLTSKGFVQLSSATNSASETLAATPKAVKAAYDLANAKYTAQDATTARKGIVQLSSATNSTSETLAATPKAVKAAYDLAAGKAPSNHTHSWEQITNVPVASLTVRGITQLSSATNSTSETLAATSKAVKVVMDETNKKAPLNSPALTGTPTTPTAPKGTNNTQIASTAYVMAAIAALVDSSPDALNTLNELAAALGNDPNFATTMTNALAGKQPKDATLTALAGLTTAADKFPYFTGNDVASLATLTKVGRDILAKSTVAAVIEYLGLQETVNKAGNAVQRSGDKMTGELKIGTMNALRIFNDAFGLIFRRSEEYLHFIPTAEGQGENGDIGPLRPFAINLRTGAISVSHGAKIDGGLALGTDNALGGNSITLGDNDTGIKQGGDGVLLFYSNGQLAFGLQPASADFYKRVAYIHQGIIPDGSGAFADQLNNATAPFVQTQFAWNPTPGGHYVPIVKGLSVRNGQGYPGAVSFGYLLTEQQGFPVPCIHMRGDNGNEALWQFNPNDKSFFSPGPVIAGGATLASNGDINGTAWGGWLSSYLRQIGVHDVRLGSQQYYGVNNWQTWNFQCPSGHVLSGINVQDTGSNSADNIAGVYYRPVQKYINGTWYNVASV
ncbi:Phage tail fiber repeat protein [Escherichia coli]|uniref:tail fiber protein n=5 Tax=Escherichia coli TaxID=562 RepID=UPI000DE56F06|nr:tail fiber protein [Escherichia coli]EHE2617294.1 phage tail protein [Escherichia coli]ELQ2790533.1 tail fiber protein [Escherichia coli]RDQ48359.1 Phage tail fiber repeat protein [Escherichia coli]RDQ59877.1 Phage tail fiber repeat protein [Escherichia coli]RDQ75723.1 Phage tail fiber repeat protein [Escherichia coli]